MHLLCRPAPAQLRCGVGAQHGHAVEDRQHAHLLRAEVADDAGPGAAGEDGELRPRREEHGADLQIEQAFGERLPKVLGREQILDDDDAAVGRVAQQLLEQHVLQVRAQQQLPLLRALRDDGRQLLLRRRAAQIHLQELRHALRHDEPRCAVVIPRPRPVPAVRPVPGEAALRVPRAHLQHDREIARRRHDVPRAASPPSSLVVSALRQTKGRRGGSSAKTASLSAGPSLCDALLTSVVRGVARPGPQNLPLDYS